MSEAIRGNPPPRRPPTPQPAAPGAPGTTRTRDAQSPGRGAADRDVRVDAEAGLMALGLQSLATALAVRQDPSGDTPDDEQGTRKQGHPDGAELAVDSRDAEVNHRLARVSQFVTHVYSVSHGQGSWNLSLPLDDELLPATVLHLGYSPSRVTLHFETRDWGVRDLLHGRTAALEQLVRQLLPPDCDVAVSL